MLITVYSVQTKGNRPNVINEHLLKRDILKKELKQLVQVDEDKRNRLEFCD